MKEHEDKIGKLEEEIKRAIILATADSENFIENSNDILYDMRLRDRELSLLKDMYKDIKIIPPEYSDGNYISDILIKASENLTGGENIKKVKDRIEYLKEHYYMMKLPETHEDFAIRSAIFQVFRSLDEFVDISNYINNKPK